MSSLRAKDPSEGKWQWIVVATRKGVFLKSWVVGKSCLAEDGTCREFPKRRNALRGENGCKKWCLD